MPGILSAISIISQILGVVGGLKGVDTTHIQPIITKVGAVADAIATLQPVHSIGAAVADAGVALTALQATGVVTGTDAQLLADVTAGIGKYAAQVKNYTSGQAAILSDKFSYEGNVGYLAAFTLDGPAAVALGLAGPAGG